MQTGENNLNRSTETERRKTQLILKQQDVRRNSLAGSEGQSSCG